MQTAHKMKWSCASWQLLMLALPLLLVVNQVLTAAVKPKIGKPCPPNSQQGCQKTCRETCEKLNETNVPMCIMPCWQGCECDKGFIFKNSQKNECVPYKDCQVDCPEHMHFDPCTRSTAATCENKAEPWAPGSQCDPWCVCDVGYVYRSAMDRTCVPLKECSQ